MEFEYHLTVNDLNLEEKEAFIHVCNIEGVKPVIIVLDHGNYINQPMVTGLIERENFQAARQEIDRVAAQFEHSGFTIVRTKVEIPPVNEQYFTQPVAAGGTPYYEWHGKVHTDDLAGLKQLCEADGGHISRNSLNANGKIRFVTVRDYESRPVFMERVNRIKTILQTHGIEMLKEQYELCIYDSREELDSGWIEMEEKA